MAELSLNLPIFLASPSDVGPEREAAEQAIRSLSREAARRRILLQPFRWEIDHFASVGRPQDPLNDELLRAEFVVVILGSRVGNGTVEELARGMRQAARGETDNVAVYFKTHSTRGSTSKGKREVLQLRERIHQTEAGLTWDFRSTQDFRKLVHRHLKLWMNRWQEVPSICEYTLQNSAPRCDPDGLDENRLALLERVFDIDSNHKLFSVLGRVVVERFQRHGVEAISMSLPPEVLNSFGSSWQASVTPVGASRGSEISLRPLVQNHTGDVFVADPEWFCFICAVGLCQAIRSNDLEAVKTQPYPNPVHQYLSAYLRRCNNDVARTLVAWLANDGIARGLPIARNFAAYVLGMIGATEAQDALADAIRNDRGKDVANYCITSLGKLRARRHIPLLVKLFSQESVEEKRLLIGQSLCRIVGVARYEL